VLNILGPSSVIIQSTVRITIYGWDLGWCRVVVFRLIVLKGDYTAREDISEAGP